MSIIAFDLDDTLCYRTQSDGGVEKYKTCRPFHDKVDLVNRLYGQGHEILIYTARGMSWFKGDIKACYDNLYDFTFKQLKDWGIKFDKLIMGKVHYDLLIDDKTLNPIDGLWDEDVMWMFVENLEDGE